MSDFFAFGSGGSVAPKFCGTDDVAIAIKGNETVLLATDTDGFDFGGDGFSLAKGTTDAAGNSVAPGMGMLFFSAGREIGEKIVLLSGGGEDLAVARIDDEDFGGLSAAIDAEQKVSHSLVSIEFGNRNRNSRAHRMRKVFRVEVILVK